MINDLATAPLQAMECDCQPSPTSRPLPLCWLRTASARTRLELVAATLRYYAVATVPRFDVEPDVGRQHIAEALLVQFPGGMHSYVFWTARDDLDAFLPDGTLIGDLTLHHSADVAEALEAALGDTGLAYHAEQPRQTTVLAGSAQR